MTSKIWKWLIVTAFVLSVTAIIFTAFRIRIVMTHDTWVGIMSSLVGAAATLIVGTQLYSSITTRKEIKSIQSLQKELKEELEWCETKFKGDHYFSQGLALWNSQEFDALSTTIRAIKCYLECKNFSNCGVALNNAEKLIRKIDGKADKVGGYNHKDTKINDTIDKIRQIKEYDLIRDRFEKIVEERERLIKLIDEREAKKAAKKAK